MVVINWLSVDFPCVIFGRWFSIPLGCIPSVYLLVSERCGQSSVLEHSQIFWLTNHQSIEMFSTTNHPANSVKKIKIGKDERISNDIGSFRHERGTNYATHRKWLNISTDPKHLRAKSVKKTDYPYRTSNQLQNIERFDHRISYAKKGECHKGWIAMMSSSPA